ncbi:MAG: prepilin peptidase [Anaerohalosphaeraceae bacterium]|nr:prepilin peptidase [Anaerohalosphaeraceae bacterium]
MPDWLILIFIFTLGASVGSFLNVVIYRLPRDKSLVSPSSACPACGAFIKFYDNIPIFSWFILLGKCRKCKAKISPRYFIIELFTAAIFVAVYVLYFMNPVRTGLPDFLQGGWLIYAVHIIMLAALIAASAIDLELWVIPLSICWLVTAVGLVASAVAPLVLEPGTIRFYALFPVASAKIAVLSAGAFVGLFFSLIFLWLGIIKTSYLGDESHPADDENSDEQNYNHRLEMLKEVIFLLPPVICSIAAIKVYSSSETFANWWIDFSQHPVIAGLAGSLWGYLIGCGVVWATRILGTMLFGKEAMGLGDVHLMGAAGAVLGPWPVVIAFFIAPFFGLFWAGSQIFFKKMRQIPYGPFLSMGLFVVMIIHDGIRNWLNSMLFR